MAFMSLDGIISICYFEGNVMVKARTCSPRYMAGFPGTGPLHKSHYIHLRIRRARQTLRWKTWMHSAIVGNPSLRDSGNRADHGQGFLPLVELSAKDGA